MLKPLAKCALAALVLLPVVVAANSTPATPLQLAQQGEQDPEAEQSRQQNQQREQQRSRIGVSAAVGGLVDDAHGRISDRFSSFIVQIDDFFGGGERTESVNKSWARIRVDTIKPGGEDPKLAGTVKLRVVLPRAQQRFRLLLSTEDDEVSAARTDAAQREQIAADSNNDVSLALRFIRTARENSRINYDLGARVRDERAQVFARINASYKSDWLFDFETRFTNNLYYYSYSGYENSFRFDFRRSMFGSDALHFRNSAEVSWRKGSKGAAFGNVIGFYADLKRSRAIALEALTAYSTALNNGETDRYKGSEVRIRYRQQFWRDWLFFELWPSVSWSASNDYRQAYGGLLRVEVVLGN